MFTKKNVPNENQGNTATVNDELQSKNSNFKGGKTRIVVKYDVGFPNSITIRGKGAGLSWEKGIPMKNVRADEWVWETEATIANGEFKVLINDKTYESGNNHPLNAGKTTQYTPKF